MRQFVFCYCITCLSRLRENVASIILVQRNGQHSDCCCITFIPHFSGLKHTPVDSCNTQLLWVMTLAWTYLDPLLQCLSPGCHLGISWELQFHLKLNLKKHPFLNSHMLPCPKSWAIGPTSFNSSNANGWRLFLVHHPVVSPIQQLVPSEQAREHVNKTEVATLTQPSLSDCLTFLLQPVP